MKSEKKNWMKSLFAYASGEKKRLALSVLLSVLSVVLGLVPFYCMYRMICLFPAGTATTAGIIRWCLIALAVYGVKILLFSLASGCGWQTGFSTRRWEMWKTTPSVRSRT